MGVVFLACLGWEGEGRKGKIPRASMDFLSASISE